MSKASDVDPFTLAIMHNFLLGIAGEMKTLTMRTAYTQLWKEQGDLSCCLMDAAGEIVAQDPNGFPIHVTTMPLQLQGALAAIGVESLNPGDVIVTNDPYIGGTHLPDVLIARPLFWKDQLYGYACNRGHWADIGGMGPGSYSPATSDVHQEGIFIPPLKLFEQGHVVPGVLEMIMCNIRNRSIGHGDLRAQYASCDTADRRLTQVIERYGFDVLCASMAEILARSEAMTRACIAEFPDGVYGARDCLDGDGLRDEPQWIEISLTIQGSDIVADLGGSSAQSTGGMNCSHSAAASAVQYAIKSITDPENPPNAGSYAPITVCTRKGTLVNAEKPASIVGFGDVVYRVLDTTMSALAAAIGDKAIATGSGSTGTFMVAGRQNRDGDDRYFTAIELSSGASGARATRDGINAMRYGPGNAGHIPLEVDEMENPLFFERYEVVPDSGGAGRYRGGNGFVRAFRTQAERTQICICADRHATRPGGLLGGQAGATARYVLDPGGPGERVLPSKTPYIDVARDTLIEVRSAGGGGYGEPTSRSRDRVARDLKDGYITEDTARTVYRYDPEDAPTGPAGKLP